MTYKARVAVCLAAVALLAISTITPAQTKSGGATKGSKEAAAALSDRQRFALENLDRVAGSSPN